MDEAVLRFELMNKFGPLGAEIEENEADIFAGCWIEHKPEFLFVVVFTENRDETIVPYQQKYPELADYIEVRTAEHSFVELLIAQEEVSDTLMDLGIDTASWVDVKENCVNINVMDPALIETAIKEGNLDIPDFCNDYSSK